MSNLFPFLSRDPRFYIQYYLSHQFPHTSQSIVSLPYHCSALHLAVLILLIFVSSPQKVQYPTQKAP